MWRPPASTFFDLCMHGVLRAWATRAACSAAGARVPHGVAVRSRSRVPPVPHAPIASRGPGSGRDLPRSARSRWSAVGVTPEPRRSSFAAPEHTSAVHPQKKQKIEKKIKKRPAKSQKLTTSFDVIKFNFEGALRARSPSQQATHVDSESGLRTPGPTPATTRPELRVHSPRRDAGGESRDAVTQYAALCCPRSWPGVRTGTKARGRVHPHATRRLICSMLSAPSIICGWFMCMCMPSQREAHTQNTTHTHASTHAHQDSRILWRRNV